MNDECGNLRTKINMIAKDDSKQRKRKEGMSRLFESHQK